MGVLAVHFALTTEDVDQLIALRGSRAHSEFILEIEDKWDEEWLCQTDKAWDAMHRCLSDGTLDDHPNPTPLQLAVLGGEELLGGDELARLVRPAQVREVAKALAGVTEGWFHARFAKLAQSDYEGPADEDDFGYTWESLRSLAELYQRAALADRAVLFNVRL